MVTSQSVNGDEYSWTFENHCNYFYHFDLGGNVVEEHTGSGLTRYVFRKNKPLARVSSEGTFFYGTDTLGLEDSTFSFQVKAAFALGGTFRFGTGHIELEE